MRLFLDTNVLASALATRGLCAELFEIVVAEHVLVCSDAVFVELQRVLSAKFKLPADLIGGYMQLLVETAELAPAVELLAVSVPDPDDAPILAAAVAARIDLFVTGDRALQSLPEADVLNVVSPRQAWTRLRRIDVD